MEGRLCWDVLCYAIIDRQASKTIPSCQDFITIDMTKALEGTTFEGFGPAILPILTLLT
jgi:hypothetical protein